MKYESKKLWSDFKISLQSTFSEFPSGASLSPLGV